MTCTTTTPACAPCGLSLIHICPDWRRDAQKLEGLLQFQHDPAVLSRLLEVKQQNKDRLCRLLWSEQGLDLDPSSVFDVQIKRFHEYKRQQMNALEMCIRDRAHSDSR